MEINVGDRFVYSYEGEDIEYYEILHVYQNFPLFYPAYNVYVCHIAGEFGTMVEVLSENNFESPNMEKTSGSTEENSTEAERENTGNNGDRCDGSQCGI